MMTPYEITILLHYGRCAGDFIPISGDRIFEDTVHSFMRVGLLIPNPTYNPTYNLYCMRSPQ